MKHKIDNRGVSLLLTLLIMAALLAIGLGVSRLSVGEIKITREVPKSIIAYYAAEAGVERAIYEERVGGGASTTPECSQALDNNSSYGILEIDRVGESVYIRSVGCYQDIRRAIEVNY